jgi:sulfatase maturation enzyme AslB (radical SAM superfamily)
MLTNYCNLACSYCFARERLETSETNGISSPPELPWEDLEKLIELFHRWKSPEFRLIGGEPSLHPRFAEILERIQSSGCSILVFTNGVIPPELVDFLAKQERVNYLVNLNPPGFYQNYPGALERIHNFFDRCRKTIQIGANIDRVDLDFDFLIAAIDRYRLRKLIRLGITNPICSFNQGAKNHFLPLSDYPKLADRLVTLSGQLFKSGLAFLFDCCLPQCMFSAEQYGQIHLNGCALPAGRCSASVDIGTDLRMWRCFATSGVFNDRLATDFAQESDTLDYFKQRFRRFQQLGIYKKCLTCPQMERGLCQGGCIGHVINRLHFDQQDVHLFGGDRRAVLAKA